MSANFLMNNYKKSMTANMKELNRLAEGDLEMQQLLLNAANNFVEERKKILDAGSSLHAQAQTKKGGFQVVLLQQQMLQLVVLNMVLTMSLLPPLLRMPPL